MVPGPGYSTDKSLPTDEPPDPPLREDGPTLEEFIAAGYKAEAYPPKGYAPVPSPGLTTYRLNQANQVAQGKPPVTPPPTTPPAETAPNLDDLTESENTEEDDLEEAEGSDPGKQKKKKKK